MVVKAETDRGIVAGASVDKTANGASLSEVSSDLREGQIGVARGRALLPEGMTKLGSGRPPTRVHNQFGSRSSLPDERPKKIALNGNDQGQLTNDRAASRSGRRSSLKKTGLVLREGEWVKIQR